MMIPSVLVMLAASLVVGCLVVADAIRAVAVALDRLTVALAPAPEGAHIAATPGPVPHMPLRDP